MSRYASSSDFIYNCPINSKGEHIYAPIDGFTIGKHEDFTEISFEQFQQYVLNQKEMKEIIGYKLKKNCKYYEGAAAKICGYKSEKLNTLYDDAVNFLKNSQNKLDIEKAGVLDLWFDPVYAQKEKMVSVGGKFNVTIKNNRIWHDSDNITDFVKTLNSELQTCYVFDSYAVYISDMIFCRTGCQNVETKLSDWRKVWEEYINNLNCG